MTWANFYLICFAVGLAFSVLSFFTAGVRWHLHLPHLPHALHGPGASGHAGTMKGGAPGQTGQISPFNPVSFAAFLAWFGGTGYLLTRFWTIWFAMGLGIALLSGVTGGRNHLPLSQQGTNVRRRESRPRRLRNDRRAGTHLRSIRQGGTGEIIYSQAGTRKTCGARAEDGAAIAKGCEVIVTRYEKGIAYVRLWTEMTGETPPADSAAEN